MLLNLYDVGIRYTHEIKEVHTSLLEGLKFPRDLYLSSVGLLELGICELRDKMMKAYEKMIIPLIAYCREYDRYVPLFNLNVADYVR